MDSYLDDHVDRGGGVATRVRRKAADACSGIEHDTRMRFHILVERVVYPYGSRGNSVTVFCIFQEARARGDSVGADRAAE